MGKGKASSAIFLLSLLVLAYVCDARKGPAGELWKTVMGEETMPKAIKDLLSVESSTRGDRFVRNFDVKPNVIIYHSHEHALSEKQKPSINMEG